MNNGNAILGIALLGVATLNASPLSDVQMIGQSDANAGEKETIYLTDEDGNRLTDEDNNYLTI